VLSDAATAQRVVSRRAENEELRALFADQLREAMLARGWDGPVRGADTYLLGDFAQSLGGEFSATVTVGVRRASVGGFVGWPGTASYHESTGPALGLGADVGVRHDPTAELVAKLGVPMLDAITKPLARPPRSSREGVLTITDRYTAERAVRHTVFLVDAEAMRFGAEHASVDTMLSFITTGQQTDQREIWRYQFVAALQAVRGRADEARAALAEGHARARTDPAFALFDRFAIRLGQWLDQQASLRIASSQSALVCERTGSDATSPG
jgi:hypothetical protein